MTRSQVRKGRGGGEVRRIGATGMCESSGDGSENSGRGNSGKSERRGVCTREGSPRIFGACPTRYRREGEFDDGVRGG